MAVLYEASAISFSPIFSYMIPIFRCASGRSAMESCLCLYSSSAFSKSFRSFCAKNVAGTSVKALAVSERTAIIGSLSSGTRSEYFFSCSAGASAFGISDEIPLTASYRTNGSSSVRERAVTSSASLPLKPDSIFKADALIIAGFSLLLIIVNKPAFASCLPCCPAAKISAS